MICMPFIHSTDVCQGPNLGIQQLTNQTKISPVIAYNSGGGGEDSEPSKYVSIAYVCGKGCYGEKECREVAWEDAFLGWDFLDPELKEAPAGGTPECNTLQDS